MTQVHTVDSTNVSKPHEPHASQPQRPESQPLVRVFAKLDFVEDFEVDVLGPWAVHALGDATNRHVHVAPCTQKTVDSAFSGLAVAVAPRFHARAEREGDMSAYLTCVEFDEKEGDCTFAAFTVQRSEVSEPMIVMALRRGSGILITAEHIPGTKDTVVVQVQAVGCCTPAHSLTGFPVALQRMADALLFGLGAGALTSSTSLENVHGSRDSWRRFMRAKRDVLAQLQLKAEGK